MCIAGQQALSDFRIKKLNAALGKIDADIVLLEVVYQYYVQLNNDLDAQAGFDTSSTADDILDFTERNPFGEVDF